MNINAPAGFYLCYPGTRTLGHWRRFDTREQAEFVRKRGLEFLEVAEVK